MSGEEVTRLSESFSYWITFLKKSKGKQVLDFQNNLTRIGDFNTAEEFWGIYQYMKRPSNLSKGCEFFLFKKDIQPLWEDEVNKNGGKFYFSCRKNDECNKIWEEL